MSNLTRRRTSVIKRAKRRIVTWMMRDRRIRRIAIAHVFDRYLTPGVLCLVPFDDHAVFVDPADDRIATTILSGQPWQREMLENACRTLDTHGRLAHGGVFLDIGANIGLLTIYALLSGRFERAVAIEPDSDNRAILHRNLVHNGLADRVLVLDCAVSSAPGRKRLHRDRHNRGAHSLEPNFATTPAGSTPVAVDTLDSVLARNAIDPATIRLVKIDVEGHERDVLEGSRAVLSHTPPLMLEATFTAHPSHSPASAGDELALSLPDTYTSWVDLDAAPPLRVTPWADFHPTRLQHELLIY